MFRQGKKMFTYFDTLLFTECQNLITFKSFLGFNLMILVECVVTKLEKK